MGSYSRSMISPALGSLARVLVIANMYVSVTLHLDGRYAMLGVVARRHYSWRGLLVGSVGWFSL